MESTPLERNQALPSLQELSLRQYINVLQQTEDDPFHLGLNEIEDKYRARLQNSVEKQELEKMRKKYQKAKKNYTRLKDVIDAQCEAEIEKEQVRIREKKAEMLSQSRSKNIGQCKSCEHLFIRSDCVIDNCESNAFCNDCEPVRKCRFCDAKFCSAHKLDHLGPCKENAMFHVCGYAPQAPDSYEELENLGFCTYDSDFSDESDLNSGFLYEELCNRKFEDGAEVPHTCAWCACIFCEDCKGTKLEDKYAGTILVCKKADCVKNAGCVLQDKRDEYLDEFGYNQSDMDDEDFW